jgi:hypothetical protein
MIELGKVGMIDEGGYGGKKERNNAIHLLWCLRDCV